MAEVGDDVCLAVPVVGGGDFLWSFNDVALIDGRVTGAYCKWLHIPNVQVEDSGVYSCSYNDGAKVPQTYTVALTVNNSVPVAAPGLLLLAAAATGLFGLRSLRRK